MVDSGLIVNVVSMCNLDYNGYISPQVVLLVLEALAEISASPAGPPRNSPSQSMSEGSLPGSEQNAAPHRQLNKYFHKFMNNVMSLFRTDRKLLEERGSFILR